MAEIVRNIRDVAFSALGLDRIPIAHERVREAGDNPVKQIDAGSSLIAAYVNAAVRISATGTLLTLVGSKVLFR